MEMHLNLYNYDSVGVYRIVIINHNDYKINFYVYSESSGQ